jgi:Cu2+-exporting ATPase
MDQALIASASSVDIAGDVVAPGLPNSQDVTLIVPGMHCGTCMATVETALLARPGVAAARTNLAARRVAVRFNPQLTDSEHLAAALERVGYPAMEATHLAGEAARGQSEDLLRRLAVAGFAAANVMLLSVSVWAGLASDMDAAAQSLFHWLSALIALPAILYAAQPFFRSARAALSVGRLNMDVPISLGIILASAMSLAQTIVAGEQVYFDAGIMLTFFLLIGRYLDESVRLRAKSAAENLLGLKATSATVLDAEGKATRVHARDLRPGMRVLVAAGERIPVDGRIACGASDIDESLITGESMPRFAGIDATVHAGTLNTNAPIEVIATATDDGTVVAEIARLMEAAEQSRGRYVRLADRAARLYAPAVHVLGAVTFIGWMIAGAGWEQSLINAIAVLIITCPCALALAVPVVQVAASARLFASGVIVKAPDTLERLSDCDTVVFDKTGTLTLGEPREAADANVDPAVLQRAAGIALNSRHPLSKALVKAAQARGLALDRALGVEEAPGSGLIVRTERGEERLGSAAWVGAEAHSTRATFWYRAPGMPPVPFLFEDALRSDAAAVVARLKHAGFAVELLSGDTAEAAHTAADVAGIASVRAGVRPAGKIERLEALKAEGRKVLMVGDGLNDAPALAAAHASLSPATAADISQTAAGAVFQSDRLAPVIESLCVAQATRRMSLQNFGIALAYNAVFVPLAVAGLVTPLLAAIAMSLSSVAVTGNALRLRTKRLTLRHPVQSQSAETELAT